jgi:hypothetical protein
VQTASLSPQLTEQPRQVPCGDESGTEQEWLWADDADAEVVVLAGAFCVSAAQPAIARMEEMIKLTARGLPDLLVLISIPRLFQGHRAHLNIAQS